MEPETTAKLVVGSVGAVILGVLLWMTFYAPCWVYSGTPAKEIPARCLKDFLPEKGR